jgi:hypothetical protein
MGRGSVRDRRAEMKKLTKPMRITFLSRAGHHVRPPKGVATHPGKIAFLTRRPPTKRKEVGDET